MWKKEWIDLIDCNFGFLKNSITYYSYSFYKKFIKVL